jgi:hypothetical protein
MSGRFWEGSLTMRRSHCVADAYSHAPTCPGLAPNISLFPTVIKNKFMISLYLLFMKFYAL